MIQFTLYGPVGCYIKPNYCPNYKARYTNGTETSFAKFEEYERRKSMCFIKDSNKAWKKARWRKKEKRMFDMFYKEYFK